MRENPWQAIDVMTDLEVGWYPTEDAAYIDPKNKDVSLSVIYRPGRKGKAKK